MVLYLIDEPYGKNGIRIAQQHEYAEIVLIQNGVYIDTKDIPKRIKIYALKDDVEKRGLRSRISSNVEIIDYSRLVDLIAEDKVVNFA